MLVFSFAVNSKLVFRRTNRNKKRQTLNMIPVHVRQKNASVNMLQVGSFQEMLSQLTQTRAGIQYDNMTLSFDTYTGGVAPENDGMKPRGGYRSTDSPKSDKNMRVHRFPPYRPTSLVSFPHCLRTLLRA